MPYFDRFPTMQYSFDGQKIIIADILKKINIRSRLKNFTDFYFLYAIKDNETPEILAYKVYGNAELHWVILFMNDIIDPLYDWPLSQPQLNEFVTLKYGAGNEFALHHYMKNGYEFPDVDARFRELSGVPDPDNLSDNTGLQIVTNYEFEDAENEKKRRIKILRQEYIPQVMSELDDLFPLR